jgi:hypothetical protein
MFRWKNVDAVLHDEEGCENFACGIGDTLLACLRGGE